MENFPSWFEALQKSHLIVPKSTFQISRRSVFKWDLLLYFWWNSKCLSILSHEYRRFQCRRYKHSPNRRTFVDVLHWIFWKMVQHLSQSIIHTVKNDRDLTERFISVAVLVSISSSMTNLSSTGLPVLVPNISSDFHTWEDHLSSMFHSEEFDELASITGLPVPVCCTFNKQYGLSDAERQARSDPLRGIVRPNSWSALILLWLFLHLHLLVFFSTSLQDYWCNWNGWCWINTKDDSIHDMWSFPLSICLRVGSWCQRIWFGSWGPNWFCQTTYQEQLSGFWERVSLQGFFPLWSSWSLLRCLQRYTIELPYEKNARLRK